MMSLVLRAFVVELVADADPSVRWNSRWLEVMQINGQKSASRWRDCIEEYAIMCNALMDDVNDPDGMGRVALERVCQIENGDLVHAELTGNAWITHVSRESVWFEALHHQEERGAVTLEQYKVALQAHVAFLLDPERKTIEVEFPDS